MVHKIKLEQSKVAGKDVLSARCSDVHIEALAAGIRVRMLLPSPPFSSPASSRPHRLQRTSCDRDSIASCKMVHQRTARLASWLIVIGLAVSPNKLLV